MKNKYLNSNLEFIVMLATALVVLLPILYSLTAYALSEAPQEFSLLIDKPDEECVRDTEYMRLHHMELLKEIRDKVVREGDRDDIKLDDCRDCHESRSLFCDNCHRTVAAEIKCFNCHYYPESPSESVFTAQETFRYASQDR